MAFKDPESRVRLVDDLQERFYSRIESIRIEGGYFDGLSAGVSGHLNAIIGGARHWQVDAAGVFEIRTRYFPQRGGCDQARRSDRAGEPRPDWWPSHPEASLRGEPDETLQGNPAVR